MLRKRREFSRIRSLNIPTNATAKRRGRSRAVRAAPVVLAERGSVSCQVSDLGIAQAIDMVGSHLAEFGDLAEVIGIEILGVLPLAGCIFIRAREARTKECRGTSLVGTFPGEQTHRDIVETENLGRTMDRVGCGCLSFRFANGGRNSLGLLGNCFHTFGGKENNPHHRPRIVTLMTTRKPTGVEACKRKGCERGKRFAHPLEMGACAMRVIRNANHDGAAIGKSGPAIHRPHNSVRSYERNAPMIATMSETTTTKSNSGPVGVGCSSFQPRLRAGTLYAR